MVNRFRVRVAHTTRRIDSHRERCLTNFALSKNLEAKFDETVARLPDALATEGFGVLTQIDVQSVFAQKINQPFRRYRIFGAYDPKLAHHALSSNLLAGIMIPCNGHATSTEFSEGNSTGLGDILPRQPERPDLCGIYTGELTRGPPLQCLVE